MHTQQKVVFVFGETSWVGYLVMTWANWYLMTPQLRFQRYKAGPADLNHSVY